MNTLSLIFVIFLAGQGYARRERGLVGGWYKQDNNNPNVENITKYAGETINDRSNSFLHKKVIHVHEAESQVVGGVKYHLIFDMASTVCRKNEAPTTITADCELHKEMPIERCDAVVWERLWLKERELLNYTCSDHMSYDDYFSSGNVSKDKDFHTVNNERANSL